MLPKAIKSHYFIYTALLLCVAYLGIELFYTFYAALGTDEFWFSHWVYRYREEIPYRDFSPYKTILGYYFLLIPMTLPMALPIALLHGLLTPLFYIKNTIALLNAILFFISMLILKKIFPKPAVLASATLIIFSEFVLNYSTNIRVDLLAYWFCLFSALLLLDKKYLLAGVLLGLGFCTSQKTLWYIVASNIALGISWLIFFRNLKNCRAIIIFNIAILVIVGIYIALWSEVSNLHTVLHSLFYEAYIMYQLDTYDPTRAFFWTRIISANPLPFLGWPLAVLSLFVMPKQNIYYQRSLFCVIYGTVIMLCLIPYKQVFPYYMLTTLPGFLLLFTALFTFIYYLVKSNGDIKIMFSNKIIWGFILIYFTSLLFLSTLIQLPEIALFIVFATFLLGIYITRSFKKITSFLYPSIPIFLLFILIFVGFLYPLSLFCGSLPNINGTYQKYNLYLANKLLQNNGDYVAGIEYFYKRNQPIRGMRHLDAPEICYLYHPTEKLRRVMLDSLYHADTTQKEIIQSLKNSTVKLYINNYRMHALPKSLKNYLASQYAHYWGSIYLYAPKISSGNQFISLKFTGKYSINSQQIIYIDGVVAKPNSVITLVKNKKYHFLALEAFRLKLIPNNINIRLELDPKYKKDTWEKMLG